MEYEYALALALSGDPSPAGRRAAAPQTLKDMKVSVLDLPHKETRATPHQWKVIINVKQTSSRSTQWLIVLK